MKADALRDTWLMFEREHRCSIDKMLCSPVLREEFLAAARHAAECDDEQAILWELMGLRKKKQLKHVATR